MNTTKVEDLPAADPVIPLPGTQLSGLALGIDVGGTGVKAALVDLATAQLVSPRVRDRTPKPSTPEAVTETIRRVVEMIVEGRDDVVADMPVGCGLPGVVKNGRLQTAANIDPGWVGWPAEERIGAAIGRRTWLVNDADAAGLAEVAYGAGKGQRGVVLLLTIGTGIGSGLFVDGVLMPNTELGHLEFHGKDAETRISGAARERRHTSWRTWGREFNDYLARVERYLWPDLIILGGGVSKEYAKFGQYLQTRARLATAAYLNTSGIIGAAYAAAAAAAVAAEARLLDPGAAAGSTPGADEVSGEDLREPGHGDNGDDEGDEA